MATVRSHPTKQYCTISSTIVQVVLRRGRISKPFFSKFISVRHQNSVCHVIKKRDQPQSTSSSMQILLCKLLRVLVSTRGLLSSVTLISPQPFSSDQCSDSMQIIYTLRSLGLSTLGVSSCPTQHLHLCPRDLARAFLRHSSCARHAPPRLVCDGVPLPRGPPKPTQPYQGRL